MNLGALLLALRPMLDDVSANWARITELLETHTSLAEYEVARYYVVQHVEPLVRERVTSIDPAARAEAVQMIELTFPAAAAGKHLRHLVRDPEVKVRAAARAAVNTLGVYDVALPDFRVRPGRDPRHGLGGWNPAGWSLGLGMWGYQRRRARVGPKLGRKSKLPALESKKDLYRLVGIDNDKHFRRLVRPGVDSGAPYVEFTVPKRSGGERRISAPREELKTVQRELLDKLLVHVPVHEAAHGFVPGRSTVTNAAPHVGAKLLVKIDIRDFFPSIHFRRVAGLMQYYRYPEDVARAIASLTTHRIKLPDGRLVWTGRVPQGAPTSPAIANIVCRRLDARLSGLARAAGARYTRYADDLTFSFADEPPSKGLGRFLWWVDAVIQQEGFAENAAKRRVLRPSHQQRVTGIVVNEHLAVPRRARRRFRAMLHNCRTKGLASQAQAADLDEGEFRAYLRGFAAYVKMVQPDLGARLVSEVAELLGAE